MKSGKLFFAVATIPLWAFIGSACAQSPSTDDQLGFVSGLSYHGSSIDHVSLSTGNLVVDIPLLSYPQRGGALGLDFHLISNGERWVVKSVGCPDGCAFLWSRAGIVPGVVEMSAPAALIDSPILSSGHPPTCPYGYTAKYLVATPDGAHHPLGNLGDYSVTVVAGNCPSEVAGSGPYVALDGTGWRVPGSPSLVNTLISPAGVRYTISPTGSPTAGSGPLLTSATVGEDANGNQISYGTNSITDTLGRNIPQPPNALTGQPSNTTTQGCTGPLPITYVYAWNPPALGGAALSYKLCYATVAISIPPSPDGTISGTLPAHPQDILLQSVVLPNNQAWTFEYSDRDPSDPGTVNYGSLTKITLPTGGTITYTYQTNSAATLGASGTSRWVTSRTVDAQDGTGPHTWQYTYAPWSGLPSGAWTFNTILTNPPATAGAQGDESLHTFTTAVGSVGCSPGSAYETQAQYFSGSHISGTLLKTVTADYQGACPFSLPARVTTTWANGQTTKTETAYDPQFSINERNGPSTVNYGVATSTSNFDYGNGAPGPLLRTTTMSYLWQSNAGYLNNNFLHLLAAATVQDSGGKQMALSSYGYDEYALNGSGVSTQHDGSPANASVRGNQTSVLRWLNGSTLSTTNCPIAVSNGNIVSYATYNDTGTVNQTTDSCGTAAGDPNHTTTFSYSPTFAGAYLTSVTNALGHTATTNYDFTTGLALSHTDANNQLTTFGYDALLRPTQVNTPDQGQTTTCYSDLGGATCTQAPPPFKVVVTKKIDPSHNLVSTAIIDGLGRKTETQINSDPACPAPGSKVDTTYDSQGRVASVTNPFCTTGDATYGVTQYAYDGLGRTTQVTHPDGSTVTSAFTGRAALVTDEGNGANSVRRIAQSDALGRLLSVCEVSSTTQPFGNGATPTACNLDIAGTGFLTTYTYDTLSNLTAVSQGGFMPRSFQYDSLSRLTSATNPESGTISYTYDTVGNVVGRTDGRNVITNYSYDKLARLTGKSYTDTTPPAAFVYDACPQGGCPNGITPQLTVGRMVEAYTPNAQTFFSYDQLGRTTNQWQCTPVNCGTNNLYALVYGYDFAGNLTSENNGFGITLTSAYDNASRLTAVTSSLSDPTHPANLLSGVQYNGLGLPSTETLGNGASETLGYDTRMRLGQLTVTSPTAIGATPGSGYVTVSGNEQPPRPGTPASNASASITISGTEGRRDVDPCFNPDLPPDQQSSCPQTFYDSGGVTITVNGHPDGTSYGQGSDATTIASGLAGTINNDGAALVWASASGATLTVTARTSGSVGNSYSFSTSSASDDTTGYFSGASFSAAPVSGSLTGGINAVPTTYDSGTVSITVNGTACSASYGQNTTAASLATALASAVTGCSNAVNALATGTTVNLTAKTGGGNTNYTLVVSSSSSNGFSPPSFSGTASGGTLTGGTGASAGMIYSLAMSYTPNGDVLTANDSVNGNWTYGYDDFNRLTSSNKSNGQQTYSYLYDRFGNRWQQNASQGGSVFLATFSAGNNRMDGASYDPAGNMTHDPTTGAYYVYDAENRIISVNNGAVTYAYDAAGERVEKNVGGIKTDYVYDLGGHAIAEISNSGSVTRQELFVGGKHLATYLNNTTYFSHGDVLGTERVRSDMTGAACETIQSLPFGDGQFTSGGCGDPSNRHFTDKERDVQTNLDYFGARYYASSIGRFVTPDWAAKPTAVPYAHFGNPQSLNLYSYVQNNPTTLDDPDGHAVGKSMPDRDPESTSCRNPFSKCWLERKQNQIDAWANNLGHEWGRQINSALVAAKEHPGDAAIGAGKEILNELDSAINPSYVVFFGNPFEASNDAQAAGMKIAFIGILFIPVEGEEAGAAKGAAKVERVFVYEIIEKGKVVYVGITNSLGRRGLEHGADLAPVLLARTRQEARAVEQVLIERYGLRNLRNEINSISPKNPIYKEAIEIGKRLLGQAGR